IEGYFRRSLLKYERVLAGGAALLLIAPSIVGAAVGGALVAFLILRTWPKKVVHGLLGNHH
ncbi:MAG: hypothetical protein CVU64_19040, partial [Deltaproteobacteria bacterium HGW-Deltaproteobacteria-21]